MAALSSTKYTGRAEAFPGRKIHDERRPPNLDGAPTRRTDISQRTCACAGYVRHMATPEDIAAELYERIDEALNVLGEGSCECSECRGCAYERKEAKAVLVLALAAYDKQLCPVCHGHCYESEPAELRTNPNGSICRVYHTCPTCGGSGVKGGYLPPSWRQNRDDVATRQGEHARGSRDGPD